MQTGDLIVDRYCKTLSCDQKVLVLTNFSNVFFVGILRIFAQKHINKHKSDSGLPYGDTQLKPYNQPSIFLKEKCGCQ